MASGQLLLIGPSTRAAAFSALRAGFQPRCVDLFADADLQARCPVTRLVGRYPLGFRHFLESDLPGPWMYTGGLENHPQFVRSMARRRPIWGNDAAVLIRCRNPVLVAGSLRSAGLPTPAVVRPSGLPPRNGCWLRKPLRGAGGTGIRFWTPQEPLPSGLRTYLQEYIEGQPLAALFFGGERTAYFLGLTRQLVGAPWLHAGPFAYCGSIGPVEPGMVQRPPLDMLGHRLASAFGLVGLFGIDGIYREGTFWPVEINPRYTASVEVLEYATGWSTLGWQAHLFAHGRLPVIKGTTVSACLTIGKAVLFAKQDLHFPAEGPWSAELRSPRPLEEVSVFADIPAADTAIAAGRPILTFFAVADSPSACEDALRQRAADLDRWLYQR